MRILLLYRGGKKIVVWIIIKVLESIKLIGVDKRNVFWWEDFNELFFLLLFEGLEVCGFCYVSVWIDLKIYYFVVVIIFNILN